MFFLYLFLDSSQASHTTGCFTGNSTVLTSTGEHRLLSELKIGEKVLSMDSNGNTIFSEVLLFLDRNIEQTREFVRIEIDGGAALTVTAKHLVLVWHMDKQSTDYRFAEHVEEGDFVLVNRNETLEPRKVIKISNELNKGVYAPLTYEGTIIVNSVTASCYALVEKHNLAHMSFMPMRVLHSIQHLFGVGESVSNEIVAKSVTQPNGIHWYAKALSNIKDNYLPSSWFLQT